MKASCRRFLKRVHKVQRHQLCKTTQGASQRQTYHLHTAEEQYVRASNSSRRQRRLDGAVCHVCLQVPTHTQYKDYHNTECGLRETAGGSAA